MLVLTIELDDSSNNKNGNILMFLPTWQFLTQNEMQPSTLNTYKNAFSDVEKSILDIFFLDYMI